MKERKEEKDREKDITEMNFAEFVNHFLSNPLVWIYPWVFLFGIFLSLLDKDFIVALIKALLEK